MEKTWTGIPERRNPNDHEIYKKFLNLITEMKIKTARRYHYLPTR